MRRLIALAALGMLLVAACGDDDDSTLGATTTSDVSTTTVAESESTTTTQASELGDLPPYHDDRASGSGCTPPTGDLPDGWWFGALPEGAADPIAPFDLMCFFVGDAAVAAAAEDGYQTAIDEGFVENDYWIRNNSQTLRDLGFSPGVEVLCINLDSADASVPVPCSRGDLSGSFNVWLRVRAGQVDRVVEQFVP